MTNPTLVTARPLAARFFTSIGALAAAVAIALSAYAAHAALDSVTKTRLDTAVLYLIVHALALCIFAPRQRTRLDLTVLATWTLGTALFSGSLIAAALWSTPTTFAPFGGTLLIAAWLLQAIASLRK